MGNVTQGSFPAPKTTEDEVKAPKPAAKSTDE